MIECKVLLPCFDPRGLGLFKEHNKFKETLIKRFGLVQRVRVEMLTRAVESTEHVSSSGAFICTYGFAYMIKCDIDDFTAFKIMAREIGHDCRLDFIDITYGYCHAEQLDLADPKKDDNWLAIAALRLKARQEANCPWPEKEVK